MKTPLFILLLIGSFLALANPSLDGDYTVNSDTTVNYYTSVVSITNADNIVVTVSDINDLDDVAGIYTNADIGPGDRIMLYQAQGATYSVANDNTASYGAFDVNNAGRYEIHEVLSVSGNDITVAEFGNLCQADQLIYGFDAGNTQVIRMPQFNNLTINNGTSILPAAWTGSVGGVVALDVAGNLVVNGAIDASGLGFRGGVLENSSSPAGEDRPLYFYAGQGDGAEKGESILGFAAAYDAYGGRYGRGAPANGGGGGNGHNSGGGGGANGDNGVTWTGQGNPDNSGLNWSNAWDIDPSINSASTSSGGGRGGYTYASSDQDALTVAPGTAAWGGNNRRELGGLGGRPLVFDDVGRLYFGGGGGAGDANNNQGGAGGAGGGLIFITTNNLSGSGQIVSNGADGEDTQGGGNNDAPGGAGAGGTIVISATTAGGVALAANGGQGGDQLSIGNENEGPGGGGGGGVIAVSGGALSTIANGGANGESQSSAVTEFLPNGATFGASGQANETTAAVTDLPICLADADLSVTKTDSADPVNPGGALTYTIRVDNAGPATASNVVVTEALPAGVTLVSTSGCTEDPNGVPTCSLGDIASGGFAQYTVAVTVNNNASGTLTNNVAVTSDTPDSDTSDNSTDENTTVNPFADLSITKTDSADPVNPGGALTYTIRVDNAGPATASNVVVTEALPAGITLVSTSGCTEDPNGVPTCSLGDIASGGFAQYTVAVTVNNNATGTLTNNVSVTSDTPDPDTSDNNTDEMTTVNPMANLAVTKTDSADPVNPGDALTYSIRVDNAGPATATNVVVTEALPADVTLVSTSGCTEDPNGVPTCSLGDIASGGFAQYTVAVTVNNNATGTLTNNVSVTSDTPDPDTSDNNTDETTGVDAEADLSISKTDSADPVTPGDALTYTIRVDNAGPSTASNVVVTEALPAGVTLVSTSGCTEDPNGVPTCSLGDIASGGFAQYTVAVTVNNDASGTLTNNVSVTSDTTDPDTSNNNTDETTDLNDAANLSITKTDSADPVTPGDALTYTIRVDNAGPATASNVVVTEALPAGVTLVSTSGCTEDPNGVPTCTLGDIASGGFAQYTVAVTVDNNTSGVITNNVSVTSDTPDPDTSDNNTDEDTVVGDAANLSISKTDSADPVNPGDALTYSIRVDNAGPATATNVVVTETLPADVTLVSTSGCTEDPNGVPTCSLGDIASGGFAQYTVAVTVNNDASGTLTNNVSVTSDTPDPDTSDNNTDETTGVNAPSLTVEKSLTNNADEDGSGSVTLNDTLTYTITATNNGDTVLNNVVVSDPMITPSSTSCLTLAIGAECQLVGTYVVQQSDVNNGQVENTGTADSDETEPETDVVVTVIGLNPDLSIDKTLTTNADEDGNGVVSLNDTVTFTIVATNTGNVDLNNVLVQDNMIMPSSTTCVLVPVGGICTLVGTYVIQQTDVDNGSLTNVATAGSDETGQQSDTTDLTITVGLPPEPAMVPSTTAWGQLMMMLMMMGLGLVVVRQRS